MAKSSIQPPTTPPAHKHHLAALLRRSSAHVDSTCHVTSHRFITAPAPHPRLTAANRAPGPLSGTPHASPPKGPLDHSDSKTKRRNSKIQCSPPAARTSAPRPPSNRPSQPAAAMFRRILGPLKEPAPNALEPAPAPQWKPGAAWRRPGKENLAVDVSEPSDFRLEAHVECDPHTGLYTGIDEFMTHAISPKGRRQPRGTSASCPSAVLIACTGCDGACVD